MSDIDPRQIRQIGGYEVVRMIAEGGMSWVFEVVDPRFDVPRALKLLKPHAAVGQEFKRFESEARVLARLDHPNIITIYDFGKDEKTDLFFYTMTLVDGATLSDAGIDSMERVCEIVLDALSGLVEIHDAGIVHRDIKPGNILVGTGGRSYLADLGIARVESTGSGETQIAGGELTRTGMMVGTLLYASPEQSRGVAVTKASDVFSMGLTLYKVLTGESVYDKVDDLQSTSGQEVMMYLGALIHSGTELAFDFPGSVPIPVRRVIMKACSMKPEDRYPDARSMYFGLRDALDGKSEGLMPGAVPRSIARAFAVLGLLLAIGAGVLWMSREGMLPLELPRLEQSEEVDEAEIERLMMLPETLVEIERLFGEAEQQLSEGSWTAPPNGNAVETYRAILALDADNAGATAGIESIRQREVEKGEAAEADDDFDTAIARYQSALRAAPRDPMLEQRISGLEERAERAEQAARVERERKAERERLAARERDKAARRAKEKRQAEAERQLLAQSQGREEQARAAEAKAQAQAGEKAEAERRAALAAREEREQKEAERAAAAKRLANANMVQVPAGAFSMGGARGASASTEAFSIDRTEVSVRDYQACVDVGACTAIQKHRKCNAGKEGRETHPVNCANFEQALEYCTWKGKRVPTGMEWEKAARGSEGMLFPWGDEPASCDRVVMRDPACEARGTAPVGSHPDGASPYGALDMMGNVWEWTEGPSSATPILRGGAWNVAPVSVDHLYPYGAKRGTPSTGIRCVR